jgi:cytochrome P450
LSSTKAQEHRKHFFDPFDEELISSPYPTYDRLRSEEPVHWCAPLRCWVLTRIEDIQAVLNDPNFMVNELSKIYAELARRVGRNYDATISVLDAMPFFQNGDRHRRDRRTIAKIMNRKVLSQLEPVIEGFAASLSSKLLGRYEYDAIKEFANPLPQFVMAHILDLPMSDVPILSELLADFTLIFDATTIDVIDRVNRNLITALDLLKDRIVEAIDGSAETALSIIYEAMSGSETERLADSAALALFAYRVGTETTIGLVGMLIRTLINKPTLYQMVCENPVLASTIVSEVLRLESIVQRAVRVARITRVIGGQTIATGEYLMLLLGAANRDPAAFAEPDTLNFAGRKVPDVVFGSGSHFCSGASLARLEGRIALEQFVQLPAVEPAGEESWFPGRAIRRLTRLPVRARGPACAVF